MNQIIDLNADLGEKIGDDPQMLRIVTSANIACGAHAGDPRSMNETVALAVENQVIIGSHPGFNDPENFGRIPQSCTPEQVYDIIMYQTGALMAYCVAHNTQLQYIKPHGALYNQLMVDLALAQGAVSAAKALHLPIMGMPYSVLESAAKSNHAGFIAEGFADRAYLSSGTLMPRSQAGAVLNHDLAVQQALQLALHQNVQSDQGSLHMGVQSICVHGDSAGAVSMARTIRQQLRQNGITVAAISPLLPRKD